MLTHLGSFLCLGSEAPALSTDHDGVSGNASTSSQTHLLSNGGGVAGLSLADDRTRGADSEQWADEAIQSSSNATAIARKAGASAAPLSAEVLDFKSIGPKRGKTDNIAEKLRVEETKAQLAAAREGMEREAARLKEEQERKEQEKKDAAAKSRFGAAATPGGGGGSTGIKWVSSRVRAGASPSTPYLSSQHHGAGKLDVQDEELFPDLASAEKILEQKEKSHQTAFKIPKKTPVGGGASWATKTTPTATPAPATVDTPSDPAPSTENDTPVAATEAATTATADADAAPVNEEEEPEPEPQSATKDAELPKVAPKKKKKKDLSTFKPTG